MEAFLQGFLPRHLPVDVDWKVIDHGSKRQLLREVPHRMKGYARHPAPCRPKTLILVDRDDDDCRVLKMRLEDACVDAGLSSRCSPVAETFDVVNRIVVEELEAWYFGDPDAVTAEWPGTNGRLRGAAFRHPDAIPFTHEAFLKLLQGAGHHRGLQRLPKIDTARRMGLSIDPARNRSPSFQTFLTRLDALVETV